MVERLHITNGDSAARLIDASSIDGDVLAWRDPMHHGPFQAGLPLDQQSALRAKYLAGDDLDRDAITADFRARDEQLRRAMSYGEVWLWFEHDLLDQLQLLQIVKELAEQGIEPGFVSIICIDCFAGIETFRGLGQLSPEQIASLAEERQSLTAEMIATARAGWSAFIDSDPRTLEQFVAASARELWFLRPALQRLLEEYPWIRDGLTRSERQILAIVENGEGAPGRIFGEVMRRERYLFAGDLTTFQWIERLSNAREPLLRCRTGNAFQMPQPSESLRTAFLAQSLELTDAGRAVVSGGVTAEGMILRDEWLGGVHITSGPLAWRWDERSQHLIQRP